MKFLRRTDSPTLYTWTAFKALKQGLYECDENGVITDPYYHQGKAKPGAKKVFTKEDMGGDAAIRQFTEATVEEAHAQTQAQMELDAVQLAEIAKISAEALLQRVNAPPGDEDEVASTETISTAEAAAVTVSVTPETETPPTEAVLSETAETINNEIPASVEAPVSEPAPVAPPARRPRGKAIKKGRTKRNANES